MALEILNKINSPEDLKQLDHAQLDQLCGELRDEILSSVSKTGGHLASNLGAVELTVAIHRVYDTAKDRLVFDVGHQSYVHKMLTGRRKDMDTLRKLGGLSGFPKPCESGHDAFIAGHASNSVSVALGMARARTNEGGDYDVVALIGDGSLTGGLAYEGLSDAGQSGESIVVILNDNGMSINRSVGGISQMLARSRIRPGYINFKKAYRRVVGKVPFLYKASHSIKEAIKRLVLPDNMFDDMGFYYIGPVDGHNIKRLESTIRWAKQLGCPVLIHAVTKKGRGWEPAEAEPGKYHGVGPFDLEKGVQSGTKRDFSSVFGNKLSALADKDESVFAITAAMADGTGLNGFASRFPDRFFDVGIAEEHAAAMAAGMAKQGAKPVMAVYSTFLQRSYDMLIHDVAIQQLHVVLGVDRAGLVGADGETHHGVFDVSYLSSIPGMSIYAPADFSELESMLEEAVMGCGGPAAVRYPRGGEGKYTAPWDGKRHTVLKDGTDVTIAAYGIMINEAISAAAALEKVGISTRIVKLNRLDRIAPEEARDVISGTRAFICAEDVCRAGCIGETILARAAQLGAVPEKAALLNLGSGLVTHGEVSQLRHKMGIDAESIAMKAAEILS